MSDWTAGYVADIGYTYGYYAELNPLHVKLAFLNAGWVAPMMGTACELGFGQGLSANMHAAASITQWHGNDFNPAQAAFAQELALAAESNAQLNDDAFADFAQRSDLPDFDYIGLHGIWSWISDENRSIIVDFIRRKLKVGGVLYISYNTQPGWAAFAPMRHLMTQHADVMGSQSSGIVSRIESALDFTGKLLDTNPSYLKANPLMRERLQKLTEQNKHYLAHEYFNRDWHPMHFANMAEWLSPAKVQFACSANYLEHIDTINLTAEQQAFLAEIQEPMFRESVRDFMVNQQFRKDYWVKGARKLSVLERAEQLRQLKVILTTARTDVPLKVPSALGEANMSEAVYGPILNHLSSHKPQTLAQIEKAVQDQGVNFSQLLQAVLILAGAGHLATVQDEVVIAKAKKHTEKLNAHLIHKSRSSNEINYLCSPVTGGGIALNRFQQLFLLAIQQGHKQPAEWAASVWTVLSAQAQKLLKDGATLETSEENLAELTLQAQAFADKQLHILKALQIA
jgi:SAM-dependent methyltransferase